MLITPESRKRFVHVFYIFDHVCVKISVDLFIFTALILLNKKYDFSVLYR
jgi:hypothetical protein